MEVIVTCAECETDTNGEIHITSVVRDTAVAARMSLSS